MQYYKDVLKNGIKLLTIPMPSLTSVTVTIWVKTGSRNETEKNNGISHFLEHMVFKGSKKRPTAKEISETIDSIGGEFNAGTSKEWTNFYVKCRKDDIETAFDVLSDMVINPVLDKKEIEKEKGTVTEEIRMYEDTPMMKIGDVFEDLIYANNSLGMDITGTEKTVRNIQKEDILSYIKSYYHTDSITISVAGGINRLIAKKLSEKYLIGVLNKKLEQKNNKFTHSQTGPKLKLYSKKKEQTHVILGFLADGKSYDFENKGRGKHAQTLLSVILGGGMSSRLFSEVRERRGLAYSIRTSMDRYSDTGYLGTYAGLDTKRAVEAVGIILDEHYKIVNGKKPIKESELSKAKEFLKGHLALALEDTRDVSTFFTDQLLFGSEVLKPDEVFERIESVTLDDVVNEARRLFVPERLNLAIIGPYESSKEFEKVII